ncbi:MAG: hypothetical protein Q8L48_22485 [Archangium sp.]|nr:hypothetical protein [Archangium sp.]
MAALIELADVARTESYRLVMRVAPLRALLLHRQHRLTLLAAGSFVVSTALALREPIFSLFFGAAVLGVPHLIAGVRHQAVKRRLSRVTRACAIGSLAVALLLVSGNGGTWCWPVLMALLGAGLISESRALTALPVSAATIAMAAFPGMAMLTITHLHAVSSLTYAAKAARLRGLSLWPLLAWFTTLTLLALAGVLDPLMADTPWVPARAFQSILDEVQLTAAGAGPAWLKRAVFIYALGQSLHYAVWLRLMPEVDRPTPNPKPFRAQLAALRADLGGWLWPAVLLAAIVLPAMLLGQGAARQLYFTLSFFHVGLEAAGLMALGRTDGTRLVTPRLDER